MNIEAIGNPSRGARSVCCGDGFCPALPAGQAADKMRQRAASMPCQDAVVTCVTCSSNAMAAGGRTPLSSRGLSVWRPLRRAAAISPSGPTYNSPPDDVFCAFCVAGSRFFLRPGDALLTKHRFFSPAGLCYHSPTEYSEGRAQFSMEPNNQDTGGWYRAINPNEHVYTPGYGFSPRPPALIERRTIYSYSCALGLSLLAYFVMGAVVPSFALAFLQLVIRPGIFPGAQPLVEQFAGAIASAAAFLAPFSFYAAYIKIPRANAAPQKPVPLRLVLPPLFICLAVSAVGYGCQRALLGFAGLFGLAFQVPALSFPADPGAAVAFALNMTVVPAILEEFVFRGVVLQSLRRFGDGFALLVSSLLFALVHVLPPQMPNAFLMGLVIGYFVLFTGSIRTGIIIHAVNNALVLFQTAVLRDLSPGVAAVVTDSFFIVYILLGLAALMLMLRNHSRLFVLPLSTAINSAPKRFCVFFSTAPMVITIVMILIMSAGYLVAL